MSAAPNTPNDAIASIKDRQDAIQAITALYGLFDSETGQTLLFDMLEKHQSELMNWLPDEPLIELAKEHMREEWKGFPWK